jgi:hypothetical protein
MAIEIALEDIDTDVPTNVHVFTTQRAGTIIYSLLILYSSFPRLVSRFVDLFTCLKTLLLGHIVQVSAPCLVSVIKLSRLQLVTSGSVFQPHVFLELRSSGYNDIRDIVMKRRSRRSKG